MKEIYIHIGTHKTGTTCIQKELSTYDKESISEGWKYIKSPRCTKNFMTSTQYDITLVNKFKAEIDTAIKKEKSAQKFILSSEALSGNPCNGYLNSDVVSLMLKEATKGYHVKIIIYLRSQDDFLESMYTQTIHEGGTSDFNTFLSCFDHPNSLNYDIFLRNFEVSFGLNNLHVQSYSHVSKEGLIKDFSKIIKSELLFKSTPTTRKNISYSRDALEIARVCNSKLNNQQKKQIRKTLQKIMFKEKSESFSFFTHSARITFMEKYKTSNKGIAKRYFKGDLDCLFPVTTHISKNDTGPTCTQVSRLLIELFEQNNNKKRSETILKKCKKVILSMIIICFYFIKSNKKTSN